jgi:periplasmic protein TonB
VAATIQLRRGSAALPRREGTAPVRDRLMAMLLLTALLHAIVLLGLSFTSGSSPSSKSPELDVLLVTNEVPEARSNEHAAYLAQRTQIGAGTTDQAQRIQSPASRGARADPRTGNTGPESAHARTDSGADRQLLATSGASPDILYIGQAATPSGGAAMPLLIGDTEGEARSGRGDAVELLLKGKSDAQHWVTPDTQASKLAPYLAAWKRKVERVGTLNFPSIARSGGLSGSPVVEVQIGANGKLMESHVRRSSGHGSLDEAAITILRLASPFDPFPPELAADYAQLRFAYQWDFVAGALQNGAVTASSDTESGP